MTMKTLLYPLRFKPVYKDYIWGGDKIIRLYHRKEPPGIYAESWEVSDRSDGMSVVSGGPLAGKSLRDVAQTFKSDLLGAKAQAQVFPLLIKLIDSRDRLSVQVHPDDETAKKYGGEAKTEMWHVLDAEPGAGVFAGLKPGVDAQAFSEALRTNRFEEILTRIPVTKGDALFIPGGLVHAIDAGCLLLEIQQNSNTTYRIYDWNRVGTNGKSRPLHWKEALQAIRWDVSANPKVQPREMGRKGSNGFWEVLSCPYFRLERMLLGEALNRENSGPSFEILFLASGKANIRWVGSSEALERGASCLIPAALKNYILEPVDAPAEVLRITADP
jgi:mannose-6-phosphate isomerase